MGLPYYNEESVYLIKQFIFGENIGINKLITYLSYSLIYSYTLYGNIYVQT